MPAVSDSFALFGLRRSFAFDRPSLRARYYELSRELHPDRFAAGGDSLEQSRSARRMGELNEAFRTLSNPRLTREHVLALEGVMPPEGAQAARGAIPLDWAEAWFELQEQVADSEPTEATRLLEEFSSRLVEWERELETRALACEGRFDVSGEEEAARRAALVELKAVLDHQSYAASLKRDVARLRERLK